MNYTSSIFAIVAVSLVLSYLTKGSKSKLEADEGGKRILRPSKAYGLAGWLGPILAACMFFAGFTESKSISEYLIWFGAGCAFLISGIYLVLFQRNFMVVFDEEKIEVTDVFKRNKTMNWKDVNKVKFGSRSQILSLIDDKQKIGIHAQTVGFSSFIDAMKNVVDESIYQEAVLKMQKII